METKAGRFMQWQKTIVRYFWPFVKSDKKLLLQAIQNLSLVGEIENHPWYVRVHNRRTACYDTHIIACRKS